MKKEAFPVLLAIFFLTLLLSGCTSNNINNNNWGDAPDFTLKTLDGDTIKLSDFKGEIVLLDMMGVDCPFCVYMMPILKYISEKDQNTNQPHHRRCSGHPGSRLFFTDLATGTALCPEKTTAYCG